MIPSKRKASVNATSSPPPASRPPSQQSPFSPTYSGASTPPSRPLTTAAAAAAAYKRMSAASNPPQQHRRQSNSSSQGATPITGAPMSRQGSVDTDSAANAGESIEDTSKAGDASDRPQDADAEDDDENKEDIITSADMDARMQAQMEKQKEDMKLLLENFSEAQLQRYEAYRRSALNRTNVRRLVSQVLNQQCSQTMAIVVAGFSKVYVGEIIEKAREIMEEWGQTGPIRPEHLREANRRYKLEKGTTSKIGKKLYRK